MPAHSAHRGARQAIFLIDDHPLVRERLRQVLEKEPGMFVCGEAEDCQGTLEAIAKARPDLIILDLSLESSDGLELLRALRKRDPNLPVLVLSMHDESLHAQRVIREGARGYITKQEATRNILHAVQTVLAGNVYLSQAQLSLMTSKLSGHQRVRAGFGVDTLTARELQVFELLGKGVSTREIADRLRLELRTVETYRARIKDKLQLKDGNELLQHAIHWVQAGALPRPGKK